MKKKRAAAAVAAVTTVGVAVGGAFPTPGVLLRPEDSTAPAPITEVLIPIPPQGDNLSDDSQGTENEDELRRRNFPAAQFRAWVLKLPRPVRAGVGIPLWCLGWLVLTGLSGLWSVLASPALSGLLGWVAAAMVLTGAFLLTAKAVLPEVPLKKIVNRRSLIVLLAGTAIITLADRVLSLCFNGYDRWGALLPAAATLVLLYAVTAAFIRRERRRQRASETAEVVCPAAEEGAETPEQAQERALRRVRTLVDEVSPGRRYYSG